MIKNFINAVHFLTIVTVKRDHEAEEGSLARSMIYFPLIGFLLGLILVYADKAMELVALPQTVANALLVAISVFLTRALHIDGLADTFDGLMGGRDHGSRLSIMKDSRLGTAGALSIFFILTLKYVCLNNLIESDKTAALLTAPMLARWSQTLMVFKARYGREEGMGKAFVGHLRASSLTAASVFAIALSSFVVVRMDMLSAIFAVSLVGGVVATTLLGRWYLIRKIGGITGDTVGAMSEMCEVLVLLLFVIFSSGN